MQLDRVSAAEDALSTARVELTEALYDATEPHVRRLDAALEDAELYVRARRLVAPRTAFPKRSAERRGRGAAQNGGLSPSLSPSPPRRPRGSQSIAQLVTSIAAGSHTPRRGAARLAREDHDSDSTTEPTYCLCEQVAFGEMIACDSPNCPVEWFHCACVGIAPGQRPQGLWICPICVKRVAEARN